MDFGNGSALVPGSNEFYRFFLGLLAGAASLQLSACAIFVKRDVPEPQLHEHCLTHDLIPSMGTIFELYAVVDCQAQSDNTMAITVQKILDQYESSLSLYQSKSEISRLNRDGILKSPSPQFLEALRLGLKHSRETDGYFDPTVRRGYRLIEKKIREDGAPPSDTALKKLLPLTNYRQIQISEQQVRFQKKGMEITLDGNVKGLAVDRVAEYLKSVGILHFLANFSGNMRIEGRHLNGRQWDIAVDHPLTREGISIPFQFSAISTSAPTYNHFTSDKSWHHLLNPKTLKPSLRFSSATVFGPSAETCDALSTAVFMMDSKAAQFIFKTHYDGYRYWLFLPDGSKIEGP
jgi:FAD:protein FMN transferase